MGKVLYSQIQLIKIDGIVTLSGIMALITQKKKENIINLPILILLVLMTGKEMKTEAQLIHYSKMLGGRTLHL